MRHLAFVAMVAVATLCGAGQYEVTIDPLGAGTANLVVVDEDEHTVWYGVEMTPNEHFTASHATWVQVWDDAIGHHEKPGASNVHPNAFQVGTYPETEYSYGATYSAKDIVAHFVPEEKITVRFLSFASWGWGTVSPRKASRTGWEGDRWSFSFSAMPHAGYMFDTWSIGLPSGATSGDVSSWNTYASGTIRSGVSVTATANFVKRPKNYPPTGPHSTQKHHSSGGGGGGDPPDDERAFIVVTVSGDLPEYFASVSKSPSEDCLYGRPGETCDVTLDATMANNRCLFTGWHEGTGSRIATSRSTTVSLTYPAAGETLYVHYTAEGHSNGTKRVVCFTMPKDVGATLVGDGLYPEDEKNFTLTEVTDETDRFRFLYWQDLFSLIRFTRMQKIVTRPFNYSQETYRAVFHEYTHMPMFDKDSGEIVQTEGSVTGDFGNAN